MAVFPIVDGALDHPKIVALSSDAFRLWVEGGSYCTRHLTDGRIPAAAVRGFRYFTHKRVAEILNARFSRVERFKGHDRVKPGVDRGDARGDAFARSTVARVAQITGARIGGRQRVTRNVTERNRRNGV
jgi:hypothetical protein